MTDFVVDVTSRAQLDLQTISAEVALRIACKMRELTQAPSPRGDTVKRLQGIDVPTYRLPIGEYRAEFRVDGKCVRVLRIIRQLDRALRDLV